MKQVFKQASRPNQAFIRPDSGLKIKSMTGHMPYKNLTDQAQALQSLAQLSLFLSLFLNNKVIVVLTSQLVVLSKTENQKQINKGSC